jgi:SAM-dependent methyltransferase
VNSVNQHNRRAWDERVESQRAHTAPAAATDFRDPLEAVDSLKWLGGNVRGRRLLCLAAGGGKHGVLFAAAGAEVTVVDLSPRMLDIDRRLAAERSLKLRVVETSMDDLSMLAAASFDIVIQPVSTCYVPDVLAVYREVARVTEPGALYISQHKQPASLQAKLLPSPRGYVLAEAYYRSGPLPAVMEGCQHREPGTLEFLHRWEELLGGLCRSGFVIEDLIEPRHGNPLSPARSFGHRSLYLPPFVTVRARRIAAPAEAHSANKLWTH